MPIITPYCILAIWLAFLCFLTAYILHRKYKISRVFWRLGVVCSGLSLFLFAAWGIIRAFHSGG